MPLLLGRPSVPLREVWAHEARDFTPWLAEAENLRCWRKRSNLVIFSFRAPKSLSAIFQLIFLRAMSKAEWSSSKTNSARPITPISGNMTCVAGQDGHATIIWIAESIREEHRAAIDWLQEDAIDGFAIFQAVEVEALRIGTSPAAPWFNVVAKPNTWESRGCKSDSLNDQRSAR